MLMMTMLMRMLVMVMVICWVGGAVQSGSKVSQENTKNKLPHFRNAVTRSVNLQLTIGHLHRYATSTLAACWTGSNWNPESLTHVACADYIPVNQHIAKTVGNFLSVIIRYHFNPRKGPGKKTAVFFCFPPLWADFNRKIGWFLNCGYDLKLTFCISHAHLGAAVQWCTAFLLTFALDLMSEWMAFSAAHGCFFPSSVYSKAPEFFSARNTQDSH